MSAERQPFAAWDGDVLRLPSAQTVPPEVRAETARTEGSVPLPPWIGAAPDWSPASLPAEPKLPVHLAPSRPEGVEQGTVPAAASPLAQRNAGASRFRRGQLIHGLLQHLPSLPAASLRDAAIRFVDQPGHDLPRGEAERIADEVLAVMAHPDLAPLFGPDSRAEVPVSGVVGEVVVGGLVDRLLVLPDRIMIADFKTNRRPPARVEDTPVMYLRQMASYRAVLRMIFPGRAVLCALIWTRDARVAILPGETLDAHDPRHAADAT